MSQTQVAAAIVVFNKDSQILLMKRKGAEGTGTWGIPGGKVDFNEDPKDSVIRELLEETGLVANDVEFITYTNDVHEHSNLHFITLRFVCYEFTGAPAIMEPNKATDIGWFDLKSLPEPLFEPARDLLTNKIHQYIKERQ